tara:strand:- start:332 stop:457 length:126 start_codon:yes stop_codon:yes gene_type:complete
MNKNDVIRVFGVLAYVAIIYFLITTVTGCEDVYICGHELDV